MFGGGACAGVLVALGAGWKVLKLTQDAFAYSLCCKRKVAGMYRARSQNYLITTVSCIKQVTNIKIFKEQVFDGQGYTVSNALV